MEFLINGDESAATYGIYFLKGTFDQLKQMPIRKEPVYKYSWKDENGASYNDEESPKFETMRFELPCLMRADDFAGFNAFYNAFYAFVTTETFFYLNAESLSKSFKVRYINTNGLRLMNYKTGADNGVYCPFTLILDFDFEYEPEPDPE